MALGTVCTGLAFLLFYAVIAEAGAARAAVITYVAPGLAVVFGVLVLNEPFGLSTAVGLALILVGSWIATQGLGGPLWRRRTLPPSATRPVAGRT